MRHRYRHLFLFFTLSAFPFLLLGVACSNNDMRVQRYAAEKTSLTPPPQASTLAMPSEGVSASAPATELTWDVPTGWISRPPSAMRLASFTVPSQDNTPPGDTSIVVLGGNGGGLAQNVNRWRGQLGLSPLAPAEIKQSAKEALSRLGRFYWFKIENDNTTADNTPASAMLAAVLEREADTIFIKLVASQPVLAAQQDNFISLCKSLRQAQ